MTDIPLPWSLMLASARAVYHTTFRVAIMAGVPQDALAAELCDMALAAGAMLDQPQVEL